MMAGNNKSELTWSHCWIDRNVYSTKLQSLSTFVIHILLVQAKIWGLRLWLKTLQDIWAYETCRYNDVLVKPGRTNIDVRSWPDIAARHSVFAARLPLTRPSKIFVFGVLDTTLFSAKKKSEVLNFDDFGEALLSAISSSKYLGNSEKLLHSISVLHMISQAVNGWQQRGYKARQSGLDMHLSSLGSCSHHYGKKFKSFACCSWSWYACSNDHPQVKWWSSSIGFITPIFFCEMATIPR